MHAFKDNKGREWKFEGNFASYGRVKAATDVQLWDIATENRESLTKLHDPWTLGQVIWAMVEPQADAKGISPEEFYEGFDGEVLERAAAALIDEMIFFCQPQKRKILQMAAEKAREIGRREERILEERAAEIDKLLDEKLDQLTRGLSDGISPESLESIPANGLSASSTTPCKADAASSGTTPVPSSPN